MYPKFNINRPKVSDEEIKEHQDFDRLVRQFKEQSIKKARGDESWWKNKKVQYATVIAGITVVCTVTYYSILKNQKQLHNANETLTTQKKEIKPAPKSTRTVNEPSQKLKINYTSYKVDNSKENTLTHPTGTKIKVPKNSFVSKSGQAIKGEVTIDYREFHDMADVIASGIPMVYDSAGKSYNFETAGMFDIKGEQNGEPVYIKPGAKLDVELASANPGTQFNQYYLDTVSQNWQCLKRDEPRLLASAAPAPQPGTGVKPLPENKKTELLQKQVNEIIPRRIDSVKTIYVKKIEKLPTATEPAKPAKYNAKTPSFRLDHSYEEFPELAIFNNVIFEVGPENKNYTKELQEIVWSDVKVSPGPDKGKNYLLTLSFRGRREQLVVYPVLEGADYDKASKLYEQKLEQYAARKEKREADEKKLLAEMEAKQAALIQEQIKQQEALKKERELLMAKYDMAAQKDLASNFNGLDNNARASRLFQISHFGIYNSDCAHTMPGGEEISPIFVSDGGRSTLNPYVVYYVCHKDKMVILLDPEKKYKFKLGSEGDYSLCVFRDNRIYMCDKSSFKAAVAAGNGQFTISPLPAGSDNLVDFKKALEI